MYSFDFLVLNFPETKSRSFLYGLRWGERKRRRRREGVGRKEPLGTNRVKAVQPPPLRHDADRAMSVKSARLDVLNHMTGPFRGVDRGLDLW